MTSEDIPLTAKCNQSSPVSWLLPTTYFKIQLSSMILKSTDEFLAHPVMKLHKENNYYMCKMNKQFLKPDFYKSIQIQKHKLSSMHAVVSMHYLCEHFEY